MLILLAFETLYRLGFGMLTVGTAIFHWLYYLLISSSRDR